MHNAYILSGLTFAKLPEIGLGDDGYIAITEQVIHVTSSYRGFHEKGTHLPVHIF